MNSKEIKEVKDSGIFPLSGWALLMWEFSIKLHKLACWLGGRKVHIANLEYDDFYHQYYCTACGWTPEDE